jgi:DNA-binding NarL/FixJ family response regulator
LLSNWDVYRLPVIAAYAQPMTLALTDTTTLTPREQEVVVALCDGNSNKAIARRLNITEGTVKVHLNNIFTKLGIANRTALVASVIGHAQAAMRETTP